MAWISEYSDRGNAESKAELQLLTDSTSAKRRSGDVVWARCLEGSTGQPFLQQKKHGSGKGNSQTVPTTKRNNCIGREMSGDNLFGESLRFTSGMVKMSWVVVYVCHQTTCGHSPQTCPSGRVILPSELMWLVGLKEILLLVLWGIWATCSNIFQSRISS